MIKNNCNIIIGTGRLGRNEGREKDLERLNTISFLLSKGCGIHISPTYGNSFQKLKKINFKNYKFPKVIAKIDFSRESKPALQLVLTRRLIREKQIDVQISGDFRNIINKDYSINEFERDLITYKQKYNIGDFYLSPLFHDSDYLFDIYKNSDLNFNLALHYSLIESEFKKKFMQEKKLSTKVFALRAFGESINNYGNWYQPLGMEIKPEIIQNEQKESIVEILSKYKIKNAEARLIFALKNPSIDYAALSFSNINQAKEAIRINENSVNKDLVYDLIKNNSEFPNKNRKGYGFRYPANNQYLISQEPIEIIISSIKTNNIIFGIKNLLKIKTLFFLRILKFIFKKITN